MTHICPTLHRLVYKTRNYEPSSKFVIHHNARDKAASDYVKALPPGMTPNERHQAWLKNQPWSILLLVGSFCLWYGKAMCSVDTHFGGFFPSSPPADHALVFALLDVLGIYYLFFFRGHI